MADEVQSDKAGAQPATDKQDYPLNFEQHYGSSCTSVRDVLNEILNDMINYKHVHRWDDKLYVPPVKQLSTALRKYLQSNNVNLNVLLAYSTVQEILTREDTNFVYRALAHPGDIERHLFFLADPLKEQHVQSARVPLATVDGHDFPAVASEGNSRAMRGRTIYLDQNLQCFERAAILFLYAFCIRLQFEQYGFIYKFIERHIGLQNTVKNPNHWHETLGPEEDSSRQRIYRRVSISWHLNYLTLSTHDASIETQNILDRIPIFPFHDQKNSASPLGLYPFKASTSILLTIAVPEETSKVYEEVKLLQEPAGLWTILAINSPPGFAADQGAHEHLTPVAQYFRAIASSLITVRTNSQSILDILRRKLQNVEGGDLFDDENYTTSNVYHWTVRTCDELRTCNAATLRFVRRAMETHVAKLRREAHVSEMTGVEYWTEQLESGIFDLEDLQEQITGLKGQVQESRNALHERLAVVEARAALQQGERMKTLSYLATLYLPLTAAASIYSMSVLPSSTTLYSFFVVVIFLLVFTIASAVYLPLLRSTVLTSSHIVRQYSQTAATAIRSFGVWTYFQKDIFKMLNPYDRVGPVFSDDHDSVWFFRYRFLYLIFRYLRSGFRRWPAYIVHSLVLELMLPRDKLAMWRYLQNKYMRYEWKIRYLVVDVVRFLLLPVWLLVIVGTTMYIIVLDLLCWVLKATAGVFG